MSKENMDAVMTMAVICINNIYKDTPPTQEQIIKQAESVREFFKDTPVTDEEFEEIKRSLESNILHYFTSAADTLHGRDSEHKSWYATQQNDGYFWNRYRMYLIKDKHWGPKVVRGLNETTNKVMDDLGDPKDHARVFQRRGLLLGDVQSGKTATYTAICNKAADAGYRVIIVLAGIMENLRIQTQSRLDSEFVGVESKYALDKKAGHNVRKQYVGVGKIPPSNSDKSIACFTSVTTDFSKSILNALGLSLKNFNGTALFVVKKNKSVLKNLYKWLKENNTDDKNTLIDLPLLLIDDEADNASVNTNKEDKNPTAINTEIRNILACFRQASYLGITATPFANIFIDPQTDEDSTVKDLFPKDFLTVLPTPENYIGADKIFGNGDADDWENENGTQRTEGPYGKAIIPVLNIEQADFFYFKHPKDIAQTLKDIPGSLKKAIRYYILATAISDYRHNTGSHRSMLVNVSRFTEVQNAAADIITNYVNSIKNDVEDYSQLILEDAMKISSIADLAETWDSFNLGTASKTSWENILKNYLWAAVRRIEVRAVNQKHGANSLNYSVFKDGMRVIAVGGNSLSRGLTLEGLCVSYFYRNTMMYDTLLQMGRWFGYRPNYEDLFKIWIAEDSIDWYGYITDAVNELKTELHRMSRLNQTPQEFGLKVRQAPGTLLITARNKMRSATKISQPITVSGRLLETPRLCSDAKTIAENQEFCESILRMISCDKAIAAVEKDDNTRAYIWHNVPKKYVINLVRNFKTHPWNLNFQPDALANYIEDDDGSLEYWDVAIPYGPKDGRDKHVLHLAEGALSVTAETRIIEKDETIKNMLRVNGHHVRVGTGGCTKIGLTSAQINEARKSALPQKPTDHTYLSVKNRKPILLLHWLYNTSGNEPKNVFALGLGFPEDGKTRTANYVINMVDLQNLMYVTDEEDED